MKEPIVIHTEEDYEAAQARARELEAAESPANHDELAALAEAMLAWELRRDEA